MPIDPLLLESAGTSVVGRRKNNEDALLVRPLLGLCAVADRSTATTSRRRWIGSAAPMHRISRACPMRSQ